jgi:hypothetical protein
LTPQGIPGHLFWGLSKQLGGSTPPAIQTLHLGYSIEIGIAIPGQFPNPGIRDWRRRDPGILEHNAHVIRDSNPGPTFSIPGFGIETSNAGITSRDL